MQQTITVVPPAGAATPIDLDLPAGPYLRIEVLGLTVDVGGLVERVRVGKQKDGTRVVLDLGQNVYRRVFYLPEPFRLVIDVSTEPPAPTTGAPSGPRGQPS